MSEARLSTTCCIAGGGPAGMMLALLLARGGVDVVVLEKHADFFRDFRGDTIHPSTIDLMDQLGIRDRFDEVPQTRVTSLDMVINGQRITPVDLRRLKNGANFLALMPQWDFLDLLAAEGRKLPNFRLIMEADATDLLRDGGRVTGVLAHTREGELRIEAELTVAADGRSSTLRDAARLPVTDFGIPVDVLWFRLPKPAENPPDTLGYITPETMMVTIPRTDYYQTAILIPKGEFPAIRDRGLDAFRRTIAATVPFLAEQAETLTDWDMVSLLSVQVNRLERWHLPGFLAIGDAAHAMSPAFGVGINYAVQDAVAAANQLVVPLRNHRTNEHDLAESDLAAVQARRARPTRTMQDIQLLLHRLIGHPGGGAALDSGFAKRVIHLAPPVLRRFTANILGRGFLPEKIGDAVLGPPV